MSFRFIDLFAGIGGFRIGMEALGGRCVFSSEIDRHAASTYERNFGDRPEGDIRAIDEEYIPDHEVLCGGFPCQPFSISGKRLGFEDARGTLFFEIMRVVRKKQPKVVFLENVANYRTHRGGETLKRTKEMLASVGYVVKDSVLNASGYGLPQARKRLYIVGVHESSQHVEFEFPEPTNKPVALRDYLLSNEEVEDLKIDRSDIKLYRDEDFEESRQNSNRPIQIGRISKGGQGERVYSILGHAITLSAHGGGVAAKTGAYKTGDMIRRLHPIECRSVMGFPKWFKPDVRRGQAYKQFGNSVAVPVIKRIGEKCLDSI